MADERRIVTTRLSDVKLRPADPDDVSAIRRRIAAVERDRQRHEEDGDQWAVDYCGGYLDALDWVLRHRMGVQP